MAEFLKDYLICNGIQHGSLVPLANGAGDLFIQLITKLKMESNIYSLDSYMLTGKFGAGSPTKMSPGKIYLCDPASDEKNFDYVYKIYVTDSEMLKKNGSIRIEVGKIYRQFSF